MYARPCCRIASVAQCADADHESTVCLYRVDDRIYRFIGVEDVFYDQYVFSRDEFVVAALEDELIAFLYEAFAAIQRDRRVINAVGKMDVAYRNVILIFFREYDTFFFFRVDPGYGASFQLAEVIRDPLG